LIAGFGRRAGLESKEDFKMTFIRKAASAALVTLSVGGMLAASVAPAAAGASTGTWRYYRPGAYGYHHGYYGHGYYGPRYGYGYGGPYYGGDYYGYRHHHSDGGAIAAGLIGGLALGAIAASASQPHYGRCWKAPRKVLVHGHWRTRRVTVCQ
jgi:hypothetical protein